MTEGLELNLLSPPLEGYKHLSVEALDARFRADPAKVVEVLKALSYHRGMAALKLLERCDEGQSPAVHKLARAVRQAILENNALFGVGLLPKILLVPPVQSAQEAARASRWLFATWTLGGFVTVTALLVREHLGMTWLPVVGAFVLTLVLFAVTRHLQRPGRSPGVLTLSPTSKTLELEDVSSRASDRRTWPLSDVVGATVNERALPTSSDENRDVTFEVVLELRDGMSFVVARRSDFVQAGRLRDQLQHLLSCDSETGEDRQQEDLI